jgi:hypothetical protein
MMAVRRRRAAGGRLRRFLHVHVENRRLVYGPNMSVLATRGASTSHIMQVEGLDAEREKALMGSQSEPLAC